jgi:hypothetical protein
LIFELKNKGYRLLRHTTQRSRDRGWHERLTWKKISFKKENTNTWKNYTYNLRRCFLKLNGEEDQLVWSLDPTHNYELRIGYKSLGVDDIDTPYIWWWKENWKFKFPSKDKLFLLFLLSNKSLMWEIL